MKLWYGRHDQAPRRVGSVRSGCRRDRRAGSAGRLDANSSGMFDDLLGGVLIVSSKKAMRVASSAAVRSKAGRFSSWFRARVPGRGGSNGSPAACPGTRADLAYAVAEADHVVKGQPDELAEVLGAAGHEVDSALAHDPHRVGMQRLGMAAGADRAHRAGRQLLGQRLRHLGARAIARAQEQHARPAGPPLGPGVGRQPARGRGGARRRRRRATLRSAPAPAT